MREEIDRAYPAIEIDDEISFLHNMTVDDHAMHIIAGMNIPAKYQQWQPAKIVGDGNCLPRTASLLVFGDEQHHEEMRTRITVEMCTGASDYINNNYLNRGMDFPKNESRNLSVSYTMFSEEYIPGTKITQAETRKVFEAEAMTIVQINRFMGIFQLFALSSVLGCKVISLYPELGADIPKLLLNRNILPRCSSNPRKTGVILWTSTRVDMQANWIPNHFVPLVERKQEPDRRAEKM